ncbi:MAG: hypothetical protein ACI33I_09670 [Clostridium sp.]
MERPNPITRMDLYLDYLDFGGDINKLPHPVSRSDVYLYKMCLNKAGIKVSSSEAETSPAEVKTYYKVLANSDSTPFNTIGGLYDLGENKRITNAKAKFRFTLRNTGNDRPNAIGVTLMADNAATEQFTAGEYNYQDDLKILSPELDKEYVVEGTYLETHNSKNLNAYRNIRPYLRLVKSNTNDSGKTLTHGIDIHEITLTIDGQDYDITNSTRVFAAKQGGTSKVEAINN